MNRRELLQSFGLAGFAGVGAARTTDANTQLPTFGDPVETTVRVDGRQLIVSSLEFTRSVAGTITGRLAGNQHPWGDRMTVAELIDRHLDGSRFVLEWETRDGDVVNGGRCVCRIVEATTGLDAEAGAWCAVLFRGEAT